MITMRVPVETSARHVHLSEQDLEILFGKYAKLTVKKQLSQPGEFASNQKVKLIGPKKFIENITVMGPTRRATQIEISLTDARSIGIRAPIRESGDLKGSAACVLEGPCGTLELGEGLIVAKRHVHLHPTNAETINAKNGDIVMVKIESPERTTIFDDVVVRIRDDFNLTMHIDTDESNAAGCEGEVFGEIIVK